MNVGTVCRPPRRARFELDASALALIHSGARHRLYRASPRVRRKSMDEPGSLAYVTLEGRALWWSDAALETARRLHQSRRTRGSRNCTLPV